MDGTFVTALVDKTSRPAAADVDGKERVFIPAGWTEVKPQPDPSPTPLAVSTLGGLVAYIEANRDALALETLALHVVNHAEVRLVSRLEEVFQRRDTYVTAAFESLFGGSFRFGQFLDAETFVIGLQTLFVPTKERDEIVTLISGIRESAVKETFDDGAAQSVNVAAGVKLVGAVKVPNPVQLAPFRTFREIDQPASLFVLRLKSGEGQGKPTAALFEADGGAWRLYAIERIAKYLREKADKRVAVLA